MSNLYPKLYTGYLKTKARIKGRIYFELFNGLSDEQWLNPHEIEQIQLSRLKKLLAHAMSNSAYYREKYADSKSLIENISSLSDLSELPLLRRSELQNNYRRMLCPSPGIGYRADSSGGSTGNPVTFYHDDIYREYSDAFDLLFLSWHGLAPGARTAVFWGADRDLKNWSLKEKLSLAMQRIKILNSFNVDEKKMDNFLKEIDKFQPDYIIGYASSLDLAAKYINRTRRFNIRPKAVKSSAETLYETQRREIENAFQTPVSNFYGSREVNNLAAECSHHHGLHIFASGKIVEVVDENGRQLPCGENGYVAVTDLNDLTFPFIRYLNGDMGIRKEGTCPCGRGYPLLEKITGRSSDILKFDEKYVHGEFFTHLFYGKPLVKQFQVVQETNNSLTVKIVSSSGQAFDVTDIREKIQSHIGNAIKMEIIFVEEIPPLKSGKYRFTVNLMAQD